MKIERKWQRILVALDESPESLSALETAVELALWMNAEVHGVFVEDEQLLHTASIPFTREIHFFGQTRKTFGASDIRRQFRLRQAKLRHLLEERAQESGLRWKFKVVQGDVSHEILNAAESADLVSLGHRGHNRSRRQEHFGSTTQEILRQNPGPILLNRPGVKIDKQVMLVYDGTELADKALEMAVHIAEVHHEPLHVLLVLPETSNESDPVVIHETMLEEMRTRFEPMALEVHIATLEGPLTWNLPIWLKESGGGLLLLPMSPAVANTHHLSEFINHLPCPVLIVR